MYMVNQHTTLGHNTTFFMPPKQRSNPSAQSIVLPLVKGLGKMMRPSKNGWPNIFFHPNKICLSNKVKIEKCKY